jgi:ribosomal protein S6
MSEAENKNEIETKGDTVERVYELGYLLVPTISEEELPANYGNLRELVGSFGGTVVSDEVPKTIPLAYSMTKVIANVRNKFNTAYFGWVKFTMDSDEVLELKKKLNLDPTIVRFLILKTVKENTIAAKRFVRGDMHSRRPRIEKNKGEETTAPINKEEIDKEIDAMVAI